MRYFEIERDGGWIAYVQQADTRKWEITFRQFANGFIADVGEETVFGTKAAATKAARAALDRLAAEAF